MTVAVQDALAYYAAHGCALFPCAAGTKRPVIKWKEGSTSDPAAWAAWAAEGHNLAIDAAKSGLIVLDVDSSKVSRDVAWGAYAALCASWNVPPLAPMTQSARGGWHVPVRRPAHLQATDLRGGGTLVKVSDVRPLQEGEIDGEVIGFKNRGYCVAAGSVLEEMGQQLPYLLFAHAPAPHAAPDALVDLLRLPVIEATYTGETGTSDTADVARLVAELDMFGEFSVEPDWYRYMGAIKLALGDTEEGVEVALQMTRDDATDEAFWSRWKRLAAVDKGGTGLCRVGTMIHRYKELTGKVYRVGKSISKMFAGVAALTGGVATSATVTQIIKDAGGTPSDSLFSGQAEFARIATPYLTDFLEAADCANLPLRPLPTPTPFPMLPDAVIGHPLYELMNAVLERISVMIEPGQKFKGARFTDPLAVLQVMNLPELYGAVTRRMANVTLQERKIKLLAEGISEEVQRVTVTLDKWELDPKTFEIQSDNPDNVEVALGIVGCEVRRNTWVKRTEIRGWEWSDWTAIDSSITNALRMRMMRTKTRFRPNKEFLRDAIDNIAMRDQHNPVLELINGFVWDGVPRLATWLPICVGVPADAYHAAVGKNVIGGIVKRARQPGCKHDEVMILMGPEGVTKSGFCRALALRDDWFTDSVSFEGSPQNIIPQMFGKLVIELAELDGMSRAEAKHVKAFITRQNDNFTPKYEAVSEDNLRRSVFVGTSNETAPLVDITGNRRFLPVRIHTAANITWLKANVEQLYAEACVLESADESFAIPEALWSTAREHQESARAVSDIEVKLLDWFAETPHTAEAFVSIPDLVDACSASNWKNSSAMCHAIMPRLGFREARPYLDGKRTNVWVRGPEMKASHIPTLTRYMVDTSQGRVRFIVRRSATPLAQPAPPLPVPSLPGTPPLPY